MGKPEDVAAAVKFLASEEAGYITGAVLERQRRNVYVACSSLSTVLHDRQRAAMRSLTNPLAMLTSGTLAADATWPPAES